MKRTPSLASMAGWISTRTKLIHTTSVILLLVSLSGCASLPQPVETVTPAPSPTPTNTPAPTLAPTRAPSGPTMLRLWLPPQFDPENGTPQGELLKARLEEFSQRRSTVNVEVRLKALSGPGGLLDSLTAANSAAPLALPDLILLPRGLLETAALKGLVFPLDGSISPLGEADWFDYAQQLAHLQKSTFGLPFAGDALILLYRPAKIAEPPKDYPTSLALSSPLIFPAAQAQSYYPLAQYLAAGGQVKDDEGRPTLSLDVLTEVLTFFQEAETAGVMPFWLTQYTSDDQAWEAYADGSADLVVTWASRYLQELPVDTAAAVIPTPDGVPFTLADGWVWALSNPRVERHALAIELAGFLTMSEFLADWTSAAGYLPPRSSALAGWPDTVQQNLVSRIVLSAQIIPTTDVLVALSPALQQATVEVLKEQNEPAIAAQEAVERVIGP